MDWLKVHILMRWKEQCWFIFISMMSDRKKINQKIDLNLLHTSCRSCLISPVNNVKRSQIHTCHDRFLRNFLHVSYTHLKENITKPYFSGINTFKNIIILIKKSLFLSTCCTLTSNNGNNVKVQ